MPNGVLAKIFSRQPKKNLPYNRIDELYYKGMRLRRDAAARASTEKSARGAQRKRGNKKGTTKRPSLGGCVPHAGREMRGSRLGYEVTSQTQAVQSTAVKTVSSRTGDFFLVDGRKF
jgi:hypothetical protein